MPEAQDAITLLTRIAEDPHAYATSWKEKHRRKVIGTFPMNFPSELVHAAGALPVGLKFGQAPKVVLGHRAAKRRM